MQEGHYGKRHEQSIDAINQRVYIGDNILLFMGTKVIKGSNGDNIGK